MAQDDIYERWQELCAEHDAARDAYLDAWAAVNGKFGAIAKGTSHTNPTDEDLSAFDGAWKKWEDVKRRMDAFVMEFS